MDGSAGVCVGRGVGVFVGAKVVIGVTVGTQVIVGNGSDVGRGVTVGTRVMVETDGCPVGVAVGAFVAVGAMVGVAVIVASIPELSGTVDGDVQADKTRNMTNTRFNIKIFLRFIVLSFNITFTLCRVCILLLRYHFWKLIRIMSVYHLRLDITTQFSVNIL